MKSKTGLDGSLQVTYRSRGKINCNCIFFSLFLILFLFKCVSTQEVGKEGSAFRLGLANSQ